MFLSAIVMMKNRRACKITPTPNITLSLCKPTDVPSRQVVVYTVNNHVILSGRLVVQRTDHARLTREILPESGNFLYFLKPLTR